MTLDELLKTRGFRGIEFIVSPLLPDRSYALFVGGWEAGTNASKVWYVSDVILEERDVYDATLGAPAIAILSREQAIQLKESIDQCRLETPQPDDQAVAILREHVEKLSGWLSRFVNQATKA